MPTKCYILFTDESGQGLRKKKKTNYWVSTGVIANLDSHDNLSDEFNQLKKMSMRLYRKEMKGADLSANHMNPGITKQNVAEELGAIIRRNGLKVIVTACNYSYKLNTLNNYVPSNDSKGLHPKDVAREMLMEKASSIIIREMKMDEMTLLLVWDISDEEELATYSKTIKLYQLKHNNKMMIGAIIPQLLGGLSHDWVELQIADLISNFAINYIADGKYDDADREKSDAFRKFIYPNLCKNSNGIIDGYGITVKNLDFD